MAVIAPTPIDAGPIVPSSADSEVTFDAAYEAFNAWEKNQLQPQANALAANVFTNAQEAVTAANTAIAKAGEATTAASTATTKAGEASASAATASTKASEASTSASTANSAASTASSAAGTATTAASTAVTKAAEASASAAQAQVFATQQLKASSTTSLTPGAGNKTFTIETGRSFVAGMYLVATSSGAPSNKMSGYVVSYDSATGVLVLAVDTVSGSTARADWVIGVAAPGSSTAGLTRQEVNTNTTCVAGVAYVVTAAGITLTLPTGWSAGDRIAIVEAIGNGAQYSIAFGTTPVRGRALGLQVISAAFGGSGELTYLNSTQGLV